jgi:flagellar hook-associated protein 3 FlgL
MASSFFPVSAGRTSGALAIQRLSYQINVDQTAILDLQTQLSTGRRIQRASEDPSAAIRALAAQRQLEFKDQIDSNLGAADSLLSATESTLAAAQSLMIEIRGLAVSATGNTLSEEERIAAVSQIQAAYSRLIELGNAKFQDQYIFAGSKAVGIPFTATGNAVQYVGKTDELLTITDTSSTIAANITAEDAFGVRSDKVVGSVDLNPTLQLSTSLNLLNGGLGVSPGVIEISNGITAAEVDLANAYNIEDVVAKIGSKQIDGRTLKATVISNGLQIEYADGLPGNLQIKEVGAGTTANDLGIATSGLIASSPIVGSDLDPLANLHTPLSSLLSGVGVPNGQTFVIHQGSRQYTISTNGTTTVEDLLNVIKRTGAKIEASLVDGKRIAIQSLESGTTLSISENGGTLATQLGLRTFDFFTPLTQLNLGEGIGTNSLTDDLTITRTNGTSFTVDLDNLLTINDVISRINNHVTNFDPTTRIVASLKPNGNGLMLSAQAGAQPISVAITGGSEAGWSLGLIPLDASSATGTTSGSSSILEGTDVSGVQVEGVFNSLARLRSAVAGGQNERMEGIVQAIDADLQRLSTARGLIGARQQSIESIQSSSAEQQIALKEVESNELDADLAEVISNLSSRQAALQASLQLMGQVTRLTLFNYI